MQIVFSEYVLDWSSLRVTWGHISELKPENIIYLSINYLCTRIMSCDNKYKLQKHMIRINFASCIDETVMLTTVKKAITVSSCRYCCKKPTINVVDYFFLWLLMHTHSIVTGRFIEAITTERKTDERDALRRHQLFVVSPLLTYINCSKCMRF